MKRDRLAAAGLAFAFVAPVAYLAQRLFERARGGPGDPLGVIREVHTAFYWRAVTAVWWAVVVAALVWWRAGGFPRASARPQWLGLAFATLFLLFALAYP